MKRSLSRAWTYLLLVPALSASLANCAKINDGGGGGPIPTPSATPTASPSPGPCGTMSPSANLVLVAMAQSIGAVKPAGYPSVFGYGVSDTYEDVPAESGLIDITKYGGTAPITTQNVIQFFNAEPLGSSTLHSAYGFPTDAFATSFPFPSPVPSPMATAIAGGVSWFTGRIATQNSAGSLCYSQAFTLKAGTYYFGDYDYYNLNNFRGILIVATPAPSRMKSRIRP